MSPYRFDYVRQRDIQSWSAFQRCCHFIFSTLYKVVQNCFPYFSDLAAGPNLEVTTILAGSEYKRSISQGIWLGIGLTAAKYNLCNRLFSISVHVRPKRLAAR